MCDIGIGQTGFSWASTYFTFQIDQDEIIYYVLRAVVSLRIEIDFVQNYVWYLADSN